MVYPIPDGAGIGVRASTSAYSALSSVGGEHVRATGAWRVKSGARGMVLVCRY
jgi:hypothetical protein